MKTSFNPSGTKARRALYQAAMNDFDAGAVRELLERGVDPATEIYGQVIAETVYDSVPRNQPWTDERLAVVEEFFRVGYGYHSVLRLNATIIEPYPVEVMRLFRKYPAPIQMADRFLMPSEHVRKGKECDVVDKLREARDIGYDVTRAWEGGWVPYHFFLDRGYVEAAWACVELGTDPNEPIRNKGEVLPSEWQNQRAQETWAAVMARVQAKGRAMHTPPLAHERARSRFRS